MCVLVVESLTCHVVAAQKGGKDGYKGWWRPCIKIIPVTKEQKHRKIGHEHRENTKKKTTQGKCREFNLNPNVLPCVIFEGHGRVKVND